MNNSTFDCRSSTLPSDVWACALGGALLLGCILASSCVSPAGSGEGNNSSAHSAPPEGSFTGLGTLPGSGKASEANAVSGDGSVIVGVSDRLGGRGISRPTKVFGIMTGNNSLAFRWTAAGGMVGLGTLPGGNYSGANAVSNDGSVVVGYTQSSKGDQPEAFRWTAAGGMVGLGTLPGTPSSDTSDARGVSNDGSVVVGSSYLLAPFPFSQRCRAFRWTAAGGMVDLGTLPGGRYSYATGVSSDGSVVVGWSAAAWRGEDKKAFRWTAAGGMVGLGTLPKPYTITTASGVSSDGSVVVGWGASQQESQAFRWTAASGIQGLPWPPNSGWGPTARALSVSADGSFVVGWHNGWTIKGDDKAFIWDSINGKRSLKSVLISDYHLDLTGWILEAAMGISADGMTIVGRGQHNGRSEGWVARLHRPPNLPATKAPEPVKSGK